MKTLLIVFHSLTGGTRQMAEAAVRGAATEAGLRVRLMRAPDATAEDVLAADGYVFATPENLDSPEVKKLLEPPLAQYLAPGE